MKIVVEFSRWQGYESGYDQIVMCFEYESCKATLLELENKVKEYINKYNEYIKSYEIYSIGFNKKRKLCERQSRITNKAQRNPKKQIAQDRDLERINTEFQDFMLAEPKEPSTNFILFGKKLSFNDFVSHHNEWGSFVFPLEFSAPSVQTLDEWFSIKSQETDI